MGLRRGFNSDGSAYTIPITDAAGSITESEFTISTIGTPLSLETNNERRLIITEDGRIGVGTADPSVKLDVDGQIKSRGGSHSRSGTIDISDGSGTYIIDYGLFDGFGLLSVKIDDIADGVWRAGGTIIGGGNHYRKDDLENIHEYQYSGGNIIANLQAYGGSNSHGFDHVGFNGRYDEPPATTWGGKVEVDIATYIDDGTYITGNLTWKLLIVD